MKKILVVALAFALVLTGFSFALAAAAPESVIEGSLENLVSELIGIVALVLMGVLTVVGRKLANYFGIKTNRETSMLLQAAAHRAVRYVEERAAHYAKRQIGGLSTGSERLDMAVDHMLRAGAKVTREEAREYIEAELARTVGAGATGERVLP